MHLLHYRKGGVDCEHWSLHVMVAAVQDSNHEQ